MSGAAERDDSTDGVHIDFSETVHIDGRLIEGENYDRVVTVLEMVAKDEMSKRKAARELDTTRSTIGSALEERPGLYGL